jgi:hypothetical protein
MLLTLSEAKKGPISRIAGVCPDNAEFLSYLNDATRQLMRRGNWWGTVQPIEGCIYGGCVTWPRMVGTVMSIVHNGRVASVANNWYSFMKWDNNLASSINCCGGVMNPRSCGTIEMVGTAPVFNDLPEPRYLRFSIEKGSDKGKTVTVYGLDEFNLPVKTTHPDGVYRNGLVVTLDSPSVTTSIKFSKIERILKDITDSRVWLYQVDNDDPTIIYDCGLYDSSETSPDYIRHRIHGATMCGHNSLVALVKLSFIPVVSDDDVVLIENQDALCYMVQSIRNKEKGDLRNAMDYERLAFRELNYELRDKFPDMQLPVAVKPFGCVTEHFNMI